MTRLPVHLLRARTSMWKVGDLSDPLTGWGDYAHDVCVTPVAGQHMTILGEPHVGGLAAALTAILQPPLRMAA